MTKIQNTSDLHRVYSEKEKDKEAALNSENKVCVLCMEIQCVLLAPSQKTSAVYYKTKPAVYNFTISDLATRDARWYVWDEGGLSSNSFHHVWLTTWDRKRLTLTTSSSAVMGASTKTETPPWWVQWPCWPKTWHHSWAEILTKGHTQMEVDSAQGPIELSQKNALIYILVDYLSTILQARRILRPYEVMHLDHSFLKDFPKVGEY